MVYEVWMRTRAGQTPARPRRRVPVPTAIGAAAVLAALTALTWWLWLGQDTTYQRTPQGGSSGPYEAPQVIACALTLAVLAALATRFLPWWVVALITSVSFTAAWSTLASSDRTGLWVVGAFGVFMGTMVGIAAAVALAALARRMWAAHH